MTLNKNKSKSLTIFLGIGVVCFSQLIVVNIEAFNISVTATAVDHRKASLVGVEYSTLNPDV